MRRSIALVFVATLCVAVVAAPATAQKKKKKPAEPQRVERVVEATYTSPALGSRDATGVCPELSNCPAFVPATNEVYLTLEITDDNGLPVPITVGQDTDPSTPTIEIVAEACGPVTEEIAIEPGLEVLVWPWVAPAAGPPPCAGSASSGTVTATFANLPKT